jgi:hypothetical protein
MDKIFRRINLFPTTFLREIMTAYAACVNVANIQKWYRHLDELTLGIESGNVKYRRIEDHIFELKVINYLNYSFPDVALSYEPVGIRPYGPNCDLGIKYEGRDYLIEIKSFHPERRCREIPEEHIAVNNKVVMNGYSYHSYQATRGHLVDAVYETEEKIANYFGTPITVLAISEGFYINREDIRDFVYIYRYNHARPDDPLGPMTMHNLREAFAGSINEFWAMPFLQDSFECTNDKRPTVIGAIMTEDYDVAIYP